jgi:Tol biopolymer transport system component
VSPDGRYLSAFSFPAPTELWVFDLNTDRWSSLAKGESFGYNLWSRDGKYIYMHDIQNGSPRIVRLSLQNKKMEEIVDLKDFQQPAGRLVNWFGLTPDGDPVVIRDLSTQEIYALDLE